MICPKSHKFVWCSVRMSWVQKGSQTIRSLGAERWSLCAEFGDRGLGESSWRRWESAAVSRQCGFQVQAIQHLAPDLGSCWRVISGKLHLTCKPGSPQGFLSHRCVKQASLSACAWHVGSMDHMFMITSSAEMGKPRYWAPKRLVRGHTGPGPESGPLILKSGFIFYDWLQYQASPVRELNKAGGQKSQASMSTQELTIRKCIKEWELWKTLAIQAAFGVSSGSHISPVLKWSLCPGWLIWGRGGGRGHS